MKVYSYGRFYLGLYPYWIGFSWRKVSGFGRVLDLGFVKFVFGYKAL